MLLLHRALGIFREKIPHFITVQTRTKMTSASSSGWPRKKINDKPITPLQTGLGKRMEFFWPRRARRTRVPMYQTADSNVVFDQRFNRFMVTWYRHGVQVFRTFSCNGRAVNFEKARMEALTLVRQLRVGGKLGKPGPDKNLAGFRGVGYDKEMKAWYAWWGDAGVRRYKVFKIEEFGFDEAFKLAVKVRQEKLKENRMFVMQRNRWRSGRVPMGTART